MESANDKQEFGRICTAAGLAIINNISESPDKHVVLTANRMAKIIKDKTAADDLYRLLVSQHMERIKTPDGYRGSTLCNETVALIGTLGAA